MLTAIKNMVQKIALKFGYMIVPDCNQIRGYTKAFYAEDGLYTQHNHDFIIDRRFWKANNAGLAAQSKSGFVHGNAWRIHVALWAATQASYLQGAFVECGTWYGRTMATVLDYLDGLPDHAVYLIDTFSGFAEGSLSATEKTRPHQYELCQYYSNDSVSWMSDVINTFAKFSNVEVIKGSVPDVLDRYTMPDKVAFLHLDMNCAAAELAADRFFWDRLVPGAVVLLDDYAYANLQEQKDAHDLFAKEAGIEILSLPTGQGLYLKPR